MGVALTFALTMFTGVGPANASASSAEALVDHCWFDLVTDQSACASTKEELAQKVFDEFGLFFEVVGGEDLPAELEVAGADAQENSLSRGGFVVQATYILGTYYTDPNYTGSSRTVTANLSTTPCRAPGSYTYGSLSQLPYFSWNDNIESYQGYGNCSFRFYADGGFMGSTYGPVKYAPSMGSFANQASSFDTRYVP